MQTATTSNDNFAPQRRRFNIGGSDAPGTTSDQQRTEFPRISEELFDRAAKAYWGMLLLRRRGIRRRRLRSDANMRRPLRGCAAEACSRCDERGFLPSRARCAKQSQF